MNHCSSFLPFLQPLLYHIILPSYHKHFPGVTFVFFFFYTHHRFTFLIAHEDTIKILKFTRSVAHLLYVHRVTKSKTRKKSHHQMYWNSAPVTRTTSRQPICCVVVHMCGIGRKSRKLAVARLDNLRDVIGVLFSLHGSLPVCGTSGQRLVSQAKPSNKLSTPPHPPPPFHPQKPMENKGATRNRNLVLTGMFGPAFK